MKQTDIITGNQSPLYLDIIQLKKLEESYRQWATDSARQDIIESRKRILLIFLLIRHTGAKLNEILTLDAEKDIDLTRNIITIRLKKTNCKKIVREIPIPQALTDEIGTMLTGPLFSSPESHGFSIDPGFVRRKFYERAEACGFDKKLGSPELIRKARGAELIQGNMPLPAVQNLMGHSTPNLTNAMVSFSEKEMGRHTQLFIEKESGRKCSARNAFYGKIESIDSAGIFSKIEMTTIDGFSVTAVITTDSLNRLGFQENMLVAAEIKATWVLLQNMSDARISCSAENQFKGTVTQIIKGKINTEYVVRISDATEICSVTTAASAMNLKEGDQVWVMFNSFSVVMGSR